MGICQKSMFVKWIILIKNNKTESDASCFEIEHSPFLSSSLLRSRRLFCRGRGEERTKRTRLERERKWEEFRWASPVYWKRGGLVDQ
jgi:hypothetical protein